MTKKGCLAMLGILTTSYPRYYANITSQQIDETTSLWSEMLSDVDDLVAAAAIKRLIAVSKFPPTVAEVRESVMKVTRPDNSSVGESWGQVKLAIRYYGYSREQEALESFDEITRKTVEAMGWQTLCMSQMDNEMADRAHYLKIYEAIKVRTEQDQLIPLELKNTIAAITKQFTMQQLNKFNICETRGEGFEGGC